MEHFFDSGDKVDVFFKTSNEWIAVEVKSKNSGSEDVKRGLFQCVKYKAVMDAEVRVSGLPVRTRAILVLGGAFPQELERTKKILGIDVRPNLKCGEGGMTDLEPALADVDFAVSPPPAQNPARARCGAFPPAAEWKPAGK